MAASCFFDVIRCIALFVGIAAGTKEKISDLVFTTWFGLGMLFFPDQVLGYQVSSKTDGIMSLWVRGFALSQLMMCLYMWMTKDSRDQTVKGSILLGRITSIAVLLMIMIYAQVTKTKSFAHGHLWFVIPFFVGLLLHNICQMYRLHPSIGRSDRKGGMSMLCRLYCLIMIVAGLQSLAFPGYALSFLGMKSSFVNQHLVRLCAASDLAAYFPVWFAPSFLRDEDRKSLFASHLLDGGLSLVFMLLSCFVDKAITVSQLYWLLMFFIPLVIPAVGLGMIVKREKVKSDVFTSRYNTRSKSD